jgi:cytochrome bd-type quinol oxidase subunit 2
MFARLFATSAILLLSVFAIMKASGEYNDDLYHNGLTISAIVLAACTVVFAIIAIWTR